MDTINPKELDIVRGFIKACDESGALFERKNREYGSAIESGGLVGAVIEIIGIAARLHQLVIVSNSRDTEDLEQIKDKLLDAHNYANIGLIMLKNGNWRGDPTYFQQHLREALTKLEEDNGTE